MLSAAQQRRFVPVLQKTILIARSRLKRNSQNFVHGMKFIPNGAKRKKTEIHLQIDTDVLEWYKSQGRGYQTKMNDVLRAHAFLQRGAEH
ncbi:MAG: BrnA antitoxin family protein [Treponema socranskii subsp. buccale]|uniref:BrnA antitoxin family protein n=2 Tax=Treponema socranskii TaxID=53419 RepID=UPI00138AF761